MSLIKPRRFESKSGDGVLLRSAVAADAENLVQYSREVLLPCDFFVTQPDEFDACEERQAAWIDKHNDCPGSLMVVAEREDELVGLLSFGCGSRRRISHTGTLSVSVRPEIRGEGVGKALMTALIDWAESHETIEKICLGVLVTNEPAIRLYRRLGFVEEGRRIRQVKLGPGEYVDDLLMYRAVDSR